MAWFPQMAFADSLSLHLLRVGAAASLGYRDEIVRCRDRRQTLAGTRGLGAAA